MIGAGSKAVFLPRNRRPVEPVSARRTSPLPGALSALPASAAGANGTLRASHQLLILCIPRLRDGSRWMNNLSYCVLA
ncbi:hypothetical protein MTO96_019899 [Rhipicephalus appendiculatus]